VTGKHAKIGKKSQDDPEETRDEEWARSLRMISIIDTAVMGQLYLL
jgi:hypothetical protein